MEDLLVLGRVPYLGIEISFTVWIWLVLMCIAAMVFARHAVQLFYAIRADVLEHRVHRLLVKHGLI